MGADEMREIAEVLVTVLHAMSPGVVAAGPNRGKPSLVQFRLDDAIAEAARSKMTDLLARHPLYPEIEL
jgi:glycine hydroxymethyltransferase